MKVILTSFIFRLLDNGLGTMKTIYLHKGKYITSALLNAASTFFYLVAMKNVITSNSLGGVFAMMFATFLGTLIPSKIVEKLEKDKLYVFDVTASTYEEGLLFADSIRDLNIPIKTIIAYNDELEKVLSCKIYCSNKAESIMIKDIMPEQFKYHAYIPKEF